MAGRLTEQGGAALFIDYGHDQVRDLQRATRAHTTPAAVTDNRVDSPRPPPHTGAQLDRRRHLTTAPIVVLRKMLCVVCLITRFVGKNDRT